MPEKADRLQLPPLEEVNLDSFDHNGGISIFMPAYNEEDNIERAVKSAAEVLQTITGNYEVLVVNDASTDRTAEIVDSLIKENSHLRMVTHKQNTRLGGALRTGFKESTKDIVFYCDADNPVNMWDVKRALPLMEKYDLVAGYRIQREERPHRLLYSAVYNFLVGAIFNIDAHDINFSFKLVRRWVLEKAELHSSGGFIDVEFIVEANLAGAKFCRVGVEYFPRTAGVSTMASFKVILKILAEMWEYYKRYRKKVNRLKRI